MEVNKDYYRPITHPKYKGLKKIGDKGQQSWLKKEISAKPRELTKESVDPKDKRSSYVDHQFISEYCFPKKGSMIGGGAAYGWIILELVLILVGKHEFNPKEEFFWFNYVALFFALFLTVYYFTMPKKEFILNRIDGTITFPGWTWFKNPTMPFSEVKFTLDKNVLLCAVRPDYIGTIVPMIMGQNHWHEDLSFITWFMDKNRPLPPGEAFDAYREIDFQRRKAEGFPPALYPSFVSTPEATPEQQAERDNYWKENVEYFQREPNSRWYDPNKDTDWKTAKYGIGKGLRIPMSNECMKYTFEDGSIVYAKTNHKGEVPEPPATMKFRINKVEVVNN